MISTTGKPEDLAPLVKKKILSVFEDHKLPVVIGGEHSVSIGAFQAAAETFSNLTILQIDAHADLRDIYEDSRYNHACVMARARELAPVVQVGIRSMSVGEKENMDYTRVFFARHLMNNSGWQDEAVQMITENVYITIDLDAFDPAYVAATGTPEPGGLDYYTVLDFLRKVNQRSRIVGFDVVELCPAVSLRASDFLATKLIYQLLSYIYFDKK